MNNVSYKIHEKINNKNNKNINYNDLLVLVNNDLNIGFKIHNREIFLKKELEKIAGYYEISTRKKKKDHLIDDIIEFEINEDNFDITERRKLLWQYIEEIKNDRYLKKFLIFK